MNVVLTNLMNDTDFGLVVYEIGHGNIVPVKEGHTNYSKVYQLHIVVDGDGEFTEMPVKAGDAFLVTPGSFYRETGRFEHYWIDFSGRDAERIMTEVGLFKWNHVFVLDKSSAGLITQSFEELTAAETRAVMTPLYLFGMLLKLILLFGGRTDSAPPSDNIRKIKEYIRCHLSEDLSLRQIAKSVHMSPKYLSNLFKSREHCPISEYIINIRLETAMLMLKQTDKSITEIALSVGYGDPLYFSRIFRSRVGISPSEWRKNGNLYAVPAFRIG